MSRRAFLMGMSGLGLSCAGAQLASSPRRKLRAVAFDLFTLFDPRSVVAEAEAIVAGRGKELCDVFRLRQFEYCWLHVAGAQFVDFRTLTERALVYAASTLKVELSSGDRERLVSAYTRLEPWPDTRAVLAELRERGLRLAPLANYTGAMIETLLESAGLRDQFDAVVSTERARTFKPSPSAYALGVEVLGFAREEIAFSAFGGWDAAGARWFGYPTFWVNRLGLPMEQLPPGPDATGPTLKELAEWIASRS